METSGLRASKKIRWDWTSDTHTHTQTDRHHDYQTKLAQWADSVKRDLKTENLNCFVIDYCIDFSIENQCHQMIKCLEIAHSVHHSFAN